MVTHKRHYGRPFTRFFPHLLTFFNILFVFSTSMIMILLLDNVGHSNSCLCVLWEPYVYMYECTYSSLLYPMAHIIKTQNDQWTEQMCFCTSNACKRLQKVCFCRPSIAAMWGVFKILPTLLVLASWTHWTGLVAWAELDGATTVGEVLPICANVDKWFLINLIPYVWPSNELIIFAT